MRIVREKGRTQGALTVHPVDTRKFDNKVCPSEIYMRCGRKLTAQLPDGKPRVHLDWSIASKIKTSRSGCSLYSRHRDVTRHVEGLVLG